MTPRERVLTAISHRQPDRVPCDFWAEEPTWRRLLEHVGHDDRDRLLDELEVDVRHLDAPSLPERAIGDGVFQNFWGERYLYQATPWGPMREDVRGALADATSLSELESFAWPHPDQFDYSAAVGPVPAVGEPRTALRIRRHLAATRTGPRLGRHVRGHAGATRMGALSQPDLHRLLQAWTTRGRQKRLADASTSIC